MGRAGPRSPRRAWEETTPRVILEEASAHEGTAAESAVERSQPIVRRGLGLFAIEADDESGLSERIRELAALGREFSGEPIDSIARRWWRRHPNDPRLPRGLAIVADDARIARGICSIWRRRHRQDPRDTASLSERDRSISPGLTRRGFRSVWRSSIRAWATTSRGWDGSSASSGPTSSAGRTRRIGYSPRSARAEVWWSGDAASAVRRPPRPDPRAGRGRQPGDRRPARAWASNPTPRSATAWASRRPWSRLRAWTDRDEMLAGCESSPLFATELAGPCDAARRAWGFPPIEPVDWVAGIVPRSAEDVRAAIAEAGTESRLRPDQEHARGDGHRRLPAGRRAASCGRSDARVVELPTVSTVHCEIGRLVEAEYRALARPRDRSRRPNIAFYSGVRARRYALDRRSAADAITAQAITDRSTSRP